jgi:hypothetical protein
MDSHISTPVASTIFSNQSPGLDSLMSEAMTSVGILKIFGSLKILKKRGSVSLAQLVYVLLLLPLLNVDNVWCFCGKFLNNYITGGKDVLYRFLKRQDINWQRIQLLSSVKIWNEIQEDALDTDLALLADDTLKIRRGKKVEASSLHYDHNTGRSVMGQQILQLGISSKQHFLPLLSQIFVGQKKRQKQNPDFGDQRRSVCKTYRNAHTKNKNQMLRAMVKQALSSGIKAYYFLADSWFANKENIQMCLDHELIGIMMMKRNRMKYCIEGKEQTLKNMYRSFSKQDFLSHQSFQYVSVQARLNLAPTKEDANYKMVKLVFSRLKKGPKQSWVVLLCTDPELEDHKIFEMYSLRWNLECYFKEAKQYLGFLKEQSSDYTVHYASIHLTAMRYSLLVYLCVKHYGGNYATARREISKTMEFCAFVELSWKWMKDGVFNVMNQQELSDVQVKKIQEALEEEISKMLHQALCLTKNEVQKLENTDKQII